MYWLGPFEYRSKQELLDRLKHFVRTADIGQVTHPVAIQKLHLLLAFYLDADRKVGVGVDHFRIDRNELAGRFNGQLILGTVLDFSGQRQALSLR